MPDVRQSLLPWLHATLCHAFFVQFGLSVCIPHLHRKFPPLHTCQPTVQRRREKRDAQQQQLAEHAQALKRTSARAASAEEELRRGSSRMCCPLEGTAAACKGNCGSPSLTHCACLTRSAPRGGGGAWQQPAALARAGRGVRAGPLQMAVLLLSMTVLVHLYWSLRWSMAVARGSWVLTFLLRYLLIIEHAERRATHPAKCSWRGGVRSCWCTCCRRASSSARCTSTSCPSSSCCCVRSGAPGVLGKTPF